MSSRSRFVPPWRGLSVLLLVACAPLLAARGLAVPARAPDGAGLVDQAGRPFALGALAGRTVVVHFVFTQCSSTCPIQTQALRRVRESLPPELAERVAFVSLSLDPAHDSPRTLARFARRHGIDVPGWWLVTGSEDALGALARAFRVDARVGADGQIAHRDAVHLLDARGRPVQTYAGPVPDSARLAREIERVDALFASDTGSGQRLAGGR